MPKIIFGLANQNIDPAEYVDGISPSVRDCYRVVIGDDEHFTKREGLYLKAEPPTPSASQGRYETFSGKVIEVIGGKVYELSSSGTLTAYTGDALNKDTHCVFAEDFSNIFIAHGGKIAKVDTSAHTVSLLGGNSPTGVTHIAFSKGYLLCNGLVSGGVEGDTNFSDDSLNGYSAVDSWEVFNNERLPDGCNSLITRGDGEVISFGPNSGEFSYDDGTTPWATIPGSFIEYGNQAPYSLTKGDNTYFWLTIYDSARRIVKMAGGVPQIISTPFDKLINSFEVVSDAVGWIQQFDGYPFYVLTFPTADVTLAYKIDSQEWCELTYYNPATASYERYRGANSLYIRAWNQTLVGDRKTGAIYQQAGTNDNGDAIRMELTSGHMESGTKKEKKEAMLHFRIKQGYGGSFQYRVKNNNGPWRNEKTVDLKNERTPLYIKKTSSGLFRSRQYQIIHSSDTPFIFMGAENDIEGTGR
jgi:hypothetical protein